MPAIKGGLLYHAAILQLSELKETRSELPISPGSQHTQRDLLIKRYQGGIRDNWRTSQSALKMSGTRWRKDGIGKRILNKFYIGSRQVLIEMEVDRHSTGRVA
jgi:hypothetical protein